MSDTDVEIKGFAEYIGPAQEGTAADQRVYALSPPHEGYAHVVVSACEVLGQPEVYIFGADDERGAIASWTELPGSLRGTLEHTEALRAAGYMLDTDFAAALRVAVTRWGMEAPAHLLALAAAVEDGGEG